MQKVLITGISGFAGSHLAENLILNNCKDISGTYLKKSSLENLNNIESKLKLYNINLLSKKDVVDIINKLRPNVIFHLAALTSPSDSFGNPTETILNNTIAQLNILEAVKSAGLKDSRILIVSSADVYGKVLEKDLPIDENTGFMPTNPYAVSKITQDYLALQYFLSYKLKIIRVRPFNHIGPRQTPSFVVSAFSKNISEIEKGKRNNVLKVGNLKSRRDFTDVRDVVEAYRIIIEKGEFGDVYNIGSSVSYKIEDMLKKLLFLSKVKINVEVDSSLFRPTDTPVLICNNKKIRELTGWKPEISIDQSLKDTLDYWRNIV